jgi:hypothetical protein
LLFLPRPIGLDNQSYFPNVIVKTSAVGDLEYEFQESIGYNATNPVPDLTMNYRNQTEYTEIFNGTYSFTGELGLTSTAISFIDSDTSGVGCSVEIVNLSDGHLEVLELNDTSGNQVEAYNLFSSGQASGSVEFWWKVEDATTTNYFFIYDGVSPCVYIVIQNDEFKYNDGVLKSTGVVALDNIWYHIKIDFEAGAGGYLGLLADTYYFHINGERYGAYGFNTVDTSLDRIRITSNGGGTDDAWWDAVGYSWDVDYNLDDNIIPYNFKNNSQEIDKWEFFNNENASATQNNQQVPPFWDEVDTLGYITKNQPLIVDETAVYFPIGDTTHQGLNRSFDYNGGIIREYYFNIGYGNRMGSQKWYTTFDIYSYDDTLITRLRMDDDLSQGNLTLNYYNGTDYLFLYDLVNLYSFYSFNLSIVENIVSLTINSTNSFTFSVIALNKDGIGNIIIESYTTGFYPATAGLFVDSIGVYVDGVSLSNDFANFFYETNQNYDHERYNLFRLNATGSFACSMISFSMSPQTHNFFSYQNITNYIFLNTYTDHQEYQVVNAYFNVVSNVSYTIYQINITGVSMVQGSNTYEADYTTGYIDDTESFFEVDNENRLNYNLTCNDANTEFIQVNFNINDINLYNKTFLYNSHRGDVLFGEIRLNYKDATTSIIEVKAGYYSEKVGLPPDKELISFEILITDNDNYNNKSMIGYFANFILRSQSNYQVDITTINILDSIIPLLFFIMLPSFMISFFLKKDKNDKVSQKVMIPLLFVFSCVAFAFGEIALWSLFLLIIGFGSLLFILYDEGESN